MKPELNNRYSSSSKKKVKIIKLNSSKQTNPLNFSQSLYLSKFLYNKLKNNQDNRKTYMNQSALIMPKNLASFYGTNKNILDKNAINKLQNSSKIYFNNYFQILKQSNNYYTNPNSCKNKDNENNEHKILYEDNLKLQTYINKLKSELLHLKSMCVKKDDEIKEFSKYVEEAKFFKKSNKKLFMLMIIKGKEILKLKDIYENIKLKLKEETDISNYFLNKTKGIDFEELTQNIEEDINILKKKSDEFRARNDINEELQKVVEKSSWKKDKFLENYKLLNNYKININNKMMNIEALNEKAKDIRQKCNQIKMEKFKMIRFNKCIKKYNIRLANDQKNLQDYFKKRKKIEKKILSYQKKTKDLVNKISENQYFIKSFFNSINGDLNNDDDNSYYEYYPKIESNPKRKEDNRVVFYESLIKESIGRQNKLIKALNDLINNHTIDKKNNYQKNNARKNNDKSNNNNDINDKKSKEKNIDKNTDKNSNDKNINIIIDNNIYKKNNNNKNNHNINNDNNKDNGNENKDISKLLDKNMDDFTNSKIFDENIINSDINAHDIKIGLKDEKMLEFIFLLNIMFYIMNITKEKLSKILLNLKTENYYLENLTEKENFIMELSEEILNKINNTKDINNLNEILLYLFEEKYAHNKIQFLDTVINDIYILNYPNIIFFNQESENILFQKLEIIYLNKIESLINKIKELQQEKILYEELKLIFTEEKLYIKENKEKIKLFQYFIYILKKRENQSGTNHSLHEFNEKNISEFLNDIKSRENDIKLKNKEFCEALKIWLKVKNMKLDKLIGEKQIIKISEFVNILNENGFELENNNLSFDYFLMKYKVEEISDYINIEFLKKDLDNI